LDAESNCTRTSDAAKPAGAVRVSRHSSCGRKRQPAGRPRSLCFRLIGPPRAWAQTGRALAWCRRQPYHELEGSDSPDRGGSSTCSRWGEGKARLREEFLSTRAESHRGRGQTARSESGIVGNLAWRYSEGKKNFQQSSGTVQRR